MQEQKNVFPNTKFSSVPPWEASKKSKPQNPHEKPGHLTINTPDNKKFIYYFQEVFYYKTDPTSKIQD
jgi:hypothetical protein